MGRGDFAYRVSFSACGKAKELYAQIDEVRVKRWGKSPPGPWKHGFYDVNSIRSNAVEEQQVGPTVPGRRLDPVSNCGTR